MNFLRISAIFAFHPLRWVPKAVSLRTTRRVFSVLETLRRAHLQPRYRPQFIVNRFFTSTATPTQSETPTIAPPRTEPASAAKARHKHQLKAKVKLATFLSGAPVADVPKRSVAYCTAQSYDYDKLRTYLSNNYPTEVLEDFNCIYTQVRLPNDIENGWADIFYFSQHGTFVGWNIPESMDEALLAEIKDFEIGSIGEPETEEMDFIYEEGRSSGLLGEVLYFQQENIQEQLQDKIATSLAMVRSVILSSLDSQLEDIIDKTKDFPMKLGSRGLYRVGNVAAMQARLWMLRMKIVLTNEPLDDAPEQLWGTPRLEDLFGKLLAHLNVSRRMDTLNRKLLQQLEMVDAVRNQHNWTKSELYSVIIIVLILVEVVINTLH